MKIEPEAARVVEETPARKARCSAPGCGKPMDAHLAGLTRCPFVASNSPPLTLLRARVVRAEA